MPGTPPPSSSPTVPESPPSVDALSASSAASAPAVPPQELSRAKRLLLFLGSTAYGLFVLFCFVLFVLLPSPTGEPHQLVTAGLLMSLLGGALFLVCGAILLHRIVRANVSIQTRRRSLLKTIAVLAPGIALSVAVPYAITREPALALTVAAPLTQEELVAPVAVTLSVEQAVATLRSRGLRATTYTWDYDGDGKANAETFQPTATALYDQQGSYRATVKIMLDDGTARVVARRIVIPRSVFSIEPLRPIVEKPVRLSIANLLPDSAALKEVDWDFDGDGVTDETSVSADVVHTFFATGPVQVSATVKLSNQSQSVYQRVVTVGETAPLPFPLTLRTEPGTLVGPAPFGALFRIETREHLKEVEWNYGDGKEERGADLTRVAHVFQRPGIFSVLTKVRTASGKIAELTTIVRATEVLQLPDLRFDGEPAVERNAIAGEVPLRVSLTARTHVPLVQFSWEAPDATEAAATGALLRAIYRREGTYTILLLAEDPEGKALRLPISVDARAPTIEPSITMKPEGGVAPLRVVFDASSSFVPPGEDIAGFEWTFGDEEHGVVPELGAAQVEHVYQKPGQYTVRLTVVLASGKDVATQRTLIVRKPALTACMTTSRTRVQVGKAAELSAGCSTGKITTTLWDVRLDGDPSVQGQSTDPTYVYVFDKAGTYTVTLTVRDSLGNADTTSLRIPVTP